MEGGTIAIICCYQDRQDLFREQRQASLLNLVTLAHPKSFTLEGKESEACSVNSSHIRVWENETSFRQFDFILYHMCLEPSINTPALWCCPNKSKHSPCPGDITAQGGRGDSQRCGAGTYWCDKHFAWHPQPQPDSSPGSPLWDLWQR